jgi:hypothetical protein
MAEVATTNPASIIAFTCRVTSSEGVEAGAGGVDGHMDYTLQIRIDGYKEENRVVSFMS